KGLEEKLPRNAKVVGGLLRSMLDVERWQHIANNNIWELSTSLVCSMYDDIILGTICIIGSSFRFRLMLLKRKLSGLVPALLSAPECDLDSHHSHFNEQ
ncbi:hypothetical protein G4B88_008243, partial [Cannabis sativa]